MTEDQKSDYPGQQKKFFFKRHGVSDRL